MRILVAQSEVEAREKLASMLEQWGHQVVLAETGPQALARLNEQGGPALAIIEKNLPGQNGLEVCLQVRDRLESPYTYILYVQGENRDKGVMEAIQVGADDFLGRPVNADEMMLRLRTAERFLELQADLKRSQDAIRYQTTHDPLTGLVNRREVIATLGREVSRQRREKTMLGVILAGIDGLKGINDKYGHAAGDAVLRETVRRMRSVVRPYDTLGRYTGEEFLVLVPGCDSKAALTQADRIRAAVAQGGMDISEWGKFTGSRDGKLQVTLSLGVAEGRPDLEAGALLREVEAALHQAKSAGQNRVVAASRPEKK
jgi:two-component system, cell cycle response regulator